MPNRALGLRMMLVAAFAILLILRLALHIALSFLLPLLILLVVLSVVLVIGTRMVTKR